MASMQRIGKTATKIRQENGYTVVRYHATDVVRFNADRIYLNTGGWRSVTTKARMNQTARQFNLNYSVSQSNFNWSVRTRAGTFAYDDQTICIDRATGRALTPSAELEAMCATDTENAM